MSEDCKGLRMGVVGTGTMGLGIAQLGALVDFDVVAYDVDAAATDRAGAQLEQALASGASKGRWSEADARDARARVRFTTALEDVADREIVVEAVPESLELKREVLTRVAALLDDDDAVLATNTSSLPVSAIASALPDPNRLIGLHFFNPPPLMRLVEVVPTHVTDDDVLERALTIVRALGREPITTTDSLGFVVNRCARPFVGEALRILGERVASVEQIDGICRDAGGFRMGPLELTDLIGLDVNLQIQESFFEQSYGEPRWRPSLIQTQLVQSGRLGRKSGAGFYAYPRRGDERPAPPVGEPPATVAVFGSGPIADDLRASIGATSSDLVEVGADLTIDARPTAETPSPDAGALLVCCAAASIGGRGAAGAAGFDLAAPLAQSSCLQLARDARTRDRDALAAEGLAAALGKRVEWVSDAPGLVLGRLVAQLVNEAAFALQDGVAEPRDIDVAMRLGMNFPRGPLAWGDDLGPARCVATLDGLLAYTGDPRYRAAPLLRRVAAGSQAGRLARTGGEHE